MALTQYTKYSIDRDKSAAVCPRALLLDNPREDPKVGRDAVHLPYRNSLEYCPYRA